MPDWIWAAIALMVMGGFLVFVSILIGRAFYFARTGKSQHDPNEMDESDELQLGGSVLHPTLRPTTGHAHEGDHEHDPGTLALPVNADLPPTWKTYSPKREGVPPPTCDCHARPLEPGQQVLWWPLPPDARGRIAIRMFCPDTIQHMEPGGVDDRPQSA